MHNPNVKWNDIIGLDSAKRTIKEAVVYPIKVVLDSQLIHFNDGFYISLKNNEK